MTNDFHKDGLTPTTYPELFSEVSCLPLPQKGTSESMISGGRKVRIFHPESEVKRCFRTYPLGEGSVDSGRSGGTKPSTQKLFVVAFDQEMR